MKKKNKHDAVTRPQPAQLEGILRLADQGHLREAQEKLTRLRQAFPGFKPLLAIAYEVEARAGSQVAAVAAAWDWTQASPNSESAWEALAEAAEAAFPALALFANLRLSTLAGKPIAEPAAQTTPFGPIGFDESRRMDLCRVLLSCSRFDEAAAMVVDIDFPAARNNLALIEFARGRIAEAIALLEQSWHDTPANLFALERLIRLRVWTGGFAAIGDLVEPLLATQPRRPDDVRAKMIALLFLDRHAEADAHYREFAEPLSGDDRRELDYLGACAAWRQGDAKLAKERLRQAAADGEGMETAMTTLHELIDAGLSKDAPDWLIGDFASWWPLSLLDRLRQAAGTTSDEDALPVDMAAAGAEYLGRMAEQGGKGGRLLATTILKSRTSKGDMEALAVLRGLLSRPCGPDRQRSEIHAWLVEHGFLAKGDVSQLLVAGELREVRAHSLTIVTTPTANSDLTPADEREYARMHEELAANQIENAYRIMSLLAEKYPDKPRILANLAAVCLAMGHAEDEVEALLRRAYDIDPGYLFARTNLAKILARRNEIEAAEDMIKPLAEMEEMHISEWRAFQLAQIDIAMAKGDFASLVRLHRQLNGVDERDDF
jgi:tetratricopeptide (TPR) repeat protein